MKLVNKKVKNGTFEKIESVVWWDGNTIQVNGKHVTNMWYIDDNATKYILRNADKNKDGAFIDFTFFLDYIKRNYKLAL